MNVRPHRLILTASTVVIPLLEYMMLFYVMNIACIFVVLLVIPVRFFISFSLYKYFFRELLMNRYTAVILVIAVLQLWFPLLHAMSYSVLELDDYRNWGAVILADIGFMILTGIYRSTLLRIFKYFSSSKSIKTPQTI